MKNNIKFMGFIILAALTGFSMTACPEPEEGNTALTGSVSVRVMGSSPMGSPMGARVGFTLKADTSKLGGSGKISYQWRRGKIPAVPVGGNTSTYLLQAEDVGHYIIVTVRRSGNSSSKTSDWIGIITTSTDDLDFIPINSNTELSVSKGRISDAKVVIPSTYTKYFDFKYQDLPVTTIGDSAFEGYTVMTSVTIPDSVTNIGNGAFSGCTGLVKVFYGGADNTEWLLINIGFNNNLLTGATRYYYSEAPNADGSHWRFVAGVPTVWEG